MDIEQRFLRRKWLLENMALLVRELEFHRQYRDEENRQGSILWELNTAGGELRMWDGRSPSV